MGTFDDTLKTWEQAVRSASASQLASALKSLRTWITTESHLTSARSRALVEALIGGGFARAASHDSQRFSVAVGVFQRAVESALAEGSEPVDRPELWAAASRLVARTSVIHPDMSLVVAPILQTMAKAGPFGAIREVISKELQALTPQKIAPPAPPPPASPSPASPESTPPVPQESSFSNARLRPVTEPEVATWSDPGDQPEYPAPPAPLDLDPQDLEPTLPSAPYQPSALREEPPSQEPAPASPMTSASPPLPASAPALIPEGSESADSFSAWDGDLSFADPSIASPVRWDDSVDERPGSDSQPGPSRPLEDSTDSQPRSLDPQPPSLAPSEVIAPADAALATIFTQLREARAALARRQRDGDPEGLADAAEIAAEVLAKAPDNTATAAAHAVLCEVALERGNGPEADIELDQALQADPECEDALAVAVRLRSGGAEEAPFVADLRFAVAQGRESLLDGASDDTLEALVDASNRMANDPRPMLLATFIALNELEDDSQADDLSRRAWQTFPPERVPELGLGSELTSRAARELLNRGVTLAEAAGPQGRLDMARLGETKGHLPAGYVQMALGLARLAMYADPELSAGQRADLGMVIGEALFRLQYYDAAKAEFQRSTSLDRTRLGQSARAATDQCQVMKLRSVDDSSIVVRAGRWTDPLSDAARKSLRNRAKQLREAARAADVEATSLTTALARGLCQQVEDVPDIARLAPELHATIDKVREVRAQIEALQVESDPQHISEEASEAQQGGLLGRVSAGLGAAAAKARDLANKAQLTVRIQTAEGRHNRLLGQAGQQFFQAMRSGQLTEAILPEGVDAALQRVTGLGALVSRCKSAADQLVTEDQQLRDVLEPPI